jgi:hypothetical protein
MLRFLYKTNEKGECVPLSAPKHAWQPDPANAQTAREAADIINANNSIDNVNPSVKTKSRKRGHYNAYDAATRAKIGAYASLHGNAVAVRHFNKQFGNKINESTIRSI